MKKEIWENHRRQAEHTLSSAHDDRKAGNHDWASFKSQQAAELFLKGYLRSTGEFVTGHSVKKLLLLLTPNPEPDISACAEELDKTYIPARYPDAYADGAPFEYFRDEHSEKNIVCAEKIRDLIYGLVERTG